MARLVIFCPDAENFRTHIQRAAPDLEIQIAPADDPAAAKALVHEADYLLAWMFPPGLLDDAPRLRWIQSFGAGIDHLLAARLPDQVVLTRVVDVFGPAMAEYALGHLLAVTLRMQRVFQQQQQRIWQYFDAVLLRGSRVAVVGLGSIGREVCRTLSAAGLEVVGLSRSGSPLAEAAETRPVAELDQVLPTVQYLVLVLPLTAASRGLIDARRLALLPPGAWLLNMARGPIVVEADLLAALRSGQLGGAILDVFDREPLPPEHPFWSLDNVVVTPHVAGPDDTPTISAQLVENYRRLQAGQPLLRVVDRARGY
jgi:glyoxylate/hydroxypyruvate reductase A